MRPTPAEVMAKLGQLQPDEIARLFRDLGVRGTQGRPRLCPVARYVQNETRRRVFVTRQVYSVDRPTLTGTATPTSVAGFIALFDSGMYPDLTTGPLQFRRMT